MFNFLSKKKIDKLNKTIFLFCGRNQNPEELLLMYELNESIVKNHNLFIVSPENEWYPKPNGITDQKKSIVQMQKTLSKIREVIRKIIQKDNLNENQIILSGFSAGAAVAMELFVTGNYKSVICHNGTILDINTIKNAKNLNPIFMIHNRDDKIFTWEERFMPVKNTLLKEEYNLQTLERSHGGHAIKKEDIDYVSVFLNQI